MHLSDSPVHLSDSPVHLSDSPVHLSDSPVCISTSSTQSEIDFSSVNDMWTRLNENSVEVVDSLSFFVGECVLD